MKILSLIVLVLSFTFAAPATAADKDANYVVHGVRSCGGWINDRKKGGWPRLGNIFWITGYISAYNKQTPDVFDIMGSTDKENIYLWMDKYCQENPLSNLAEGMNVLIEELWPNRKRTEDD